MMIGHQLQLPTVKVRTDLKVAGDQKMDGVKGDPWNLMASHYPRTETVSLNSMEIYKPKLCVKLLPKACLRLQIFS
jgi:hypothetical protein